VFEEVEEDVMQNWLVDQQEQFNEAFFESLKSRYEIVIENAPSEADNGLLENTDIAEETDSNEEPAS
jgi:hypothetical protein